MVRRRPQVVPPTYSVLEQHYEPPQPPSQSTATAFVQPSLTDRSYPTEEVEAKTPSSSSDAHSTPSHSSTDSVFGGQTESEKDFSSADGERRSTKRALHRHPTIRALWSKIKPLLAVAMLFTQSFLVNGWLRGPSEDVYDRLGHLHRMDRMGDVARSMIAGLALELIAIICPCMSPYLSRCTISGDPLLDLFGARSTLGSKCRCLHTALLLFAAGRGGETGSVLFRTVPGFWTISSTMILILSWYWHTIAGHRPNFTSSFVPSLMFVIFEHFTWSLIFIYYPLWLEFAVPYLSFPPLNQRVLSIIYK